MGRFTWPVTPQALSENCAAGKTWRFTFLTDRLVRLEYDPQGLFEDRASQSVFHRDFPAVAFEKEEADGVLTLRSKGLTLTYRIGEEFSADSLCVALNAPPASVWRFGEDFDALWGTVSTLDRVDGACALEKSVCSRGGFSVLDDTPHMLLDEEGWPTPRRKNTKDFYFFGYGHDYRTAVADLMRLTGRPPMLPDWALGNWWSRYYKYTQQQYLDLMDRFRREDIPFSVGVVDMDWHITDNPPTEEENLAECPHEHEGPGWTGYTWNKALFPDYKAFLKGLHERGLHTALNLHPALGVRAHEEMYPEMARACGIDPASGKQVKLNVLSSSFMEKYFDILHHPYEKDGVDFWWMDWQQGKSYWWIHKANRPGELSDPREEMDPLWLLNHLHILDISRTGARPMFFSRYCGPGSQRYPVGFSGDTFITWDSLRFQPEFTASASNVGYGWWSHDIGGHMCGYHDAELTERWVQLGVFSPINRLHSTCNEYVNKEPWAFPPETERRMTDALRLRHRLFPYLYTMNRRCYAELRPLVEPMYWEYPEKDMAYAVPNQFFFGSELMVAPITESSDKNSHCGRVKAFLPDGKWIDAFDGTVYEGCGGRFLDLWRSRDRIPVLARAGAIVPMAVHAPHDNTLPSNDWEIFVFPGADRTFTLYEDAGDGDGYQHGEWAQTELSLTWGSERAQLRIAPTEGLWKPSVGAQKISLRLRGWQKPERIVRGGKELAFTYERETHTVCLELSRERGEKICLSIEGKQLCYQNEDRLERCIALLRDADIGMGIKTRLTPWLEKFDPQAPRTNLLFTLNAIAESREEREAVQPIFEQLLCDRPRYEI